MTTDELNQLAHQIAYSAARTDIECMTTASFEAPDGTFKDTGSLEHRWYDLSAKITDAFERKVVANAILYLDGRGLLHRHRGLPFMVRILDAPGEGTPPEGLRLQPIKQGSHTA